MSVFKLCQKIIRRNILALSVYLLVFLVMTLIIIGSGSTAAEAGFRQSRVPIAVMIPEKSPLMDGLKKELSKSSELITLPPGIDGVRDALFFGQVRYVLDVPSGFGPAYMKGEIKPMTAYYRAEERSGRYVEMAIDHYFRLARLYRDNLPDMGEEELVRSIARNLERQTRVVLHQDRNLSPSLPFAEAYFNFMSYSLFNLLILGICALMLVFNQKEIRLRNVCSPISLRKLNGQILLSGLLYSLICWGIMSLLCLLVQREAIPVVNLMLFLLNGLVFTVWGASAAFAIGQFMVNREAVSGMATVVTLASSFLGGAFVPQAFLGRGLLKVSQFLPTYWYLRTNHLIAGIGSFRLADSAPFLHALSMQLLFALAFVSLALLVARKKRQLV